jgi:aminobenzoyl-glutamate utilization protein A
MKGGLIGVVGTIGSGSPVTAFRFDIDALPIQEEHQNIHKPYSEQFHSTNTNISHACGHDGHTSIGLGLAKTISENKDSLKGTIKIIFQPAEEGCRGAYSMVDAGVVDDVDTLICMHLGLMAKSGMIVAGAKGFSMIREIIKVSKEKSLS